MAAIAPARRKTMRSPAGILVTSSMTAPTIPAAGSVRAQATAMFPAIPQRTAENFAARAGAHHRACDRLRRRDREAEVRGRPEDPCDAVCAANPCGGLIFAMRVPIVLMIRHPPA